MTDKDLTERKTLSEEFPDAVLRPCLFHTLRSFKREFSLHKLGLRPGTRDTALDIFGEMANAKSPHLFDEPYVALKNIGLRAAVDFFEKHWLPIKEEWVACYKNSKSTLGELNNNRLESVNGKIKSVWSKFASLDTFFSEFFDVLYVLCGESNHSHIMQRTKTPAYSLIVEQLLL